MLKNSDIIHVRPAGGAVKNAKGVVLCAFFWSINLSGGKNDTELLLYFQLAVL